MQLEELTGKVMLESDRTEYKGRLNRQDVVGWLKTVAGFANADGGVFYIGVEDKSHKLLGFERAEADKERNFFNNQVNEHLIPRPFFEIEFLSYEMHGKVLFIIRISVKKSPVRPIILKYKGIPSIFMRRNGFTDGATYEEIRQMSIASENASYDSFFSDKKYDGKDFLKLKDFYASHNGGKALPDKALCSLGFFDAKGRLANGAVLFSDTYQGTKTSMTCSVFSGINKGSERIVAINHFQGNIINSINYACEFVLQRMNYGILKLEDRRVNQPAYPKRALLEGVVNAIAHRDYFMDGSQIQIDMFSDRLEISSPGSFYQGAPIEKTYELSSIISKRRNELICGVLVMCNVMEAAGTGFDKIAEEYASADSLHKPYIFSASDHFTLVLPDLTYMAGVSAPGEAIEYAPVSNETKYDRTILAFCLNSSHSVAEIASRLNISDSSYFRKKVLGNLVQQGHLKEGKKGRKKIYTSDPEMVRLG